MIEPNERERVKASLANLVEAKQEIQDTCHILSFIKGLSAESNILNSCIEIMDEVAEMLFQKSKREEL